MPHCWYHLQPVHVRMRLYRRLSKRKSLRRPRNPILPMTPCLRTPRCGPVVRRIFALAAIVSLGAVSCGTEFDSCEASRTCPSSPRAGNGGAGTGFGAGAGGTSGSAGSAPGGGRAGATAGVGHGGNAGEGESGGEGGNAGDAAAGGTEPCDAECSGERSVCDIPTDTCVACTSNTHCDDDAPLCDTASHTCVECTSDEAGACKDATPVCNPDTNRCVECLDNEPCTNPAASLCNASHRCAPCVDNGDCSHLSESGVCDDGTCVECTVADETACGQHSCDPAANRCTTTRRGTLYPCEPCLADSECVGAEQSDPEQRCVPMHFQGDIRTGGFCLRPVAKGCVRPYMTVLNRPSLSGAESEAYCGIPEEATRCEAITDMVASRACAGDDSACGCPRDWAGNCLEAGSGGMCRKINALPDDRCTYPCGALNQCPSGMICDGIPQPYCTH